MWGGLRSRRRVAAQKYRVHERNSSSMIQLVWRLKVPIETRHFVQHLPFDQQSGNFSNSAVSVYVVHDSCVVQFPGTTNLRGPKQTGRPITLYTKGLKRSRYIIHGTHYSTLYNATSTRYLLAIKDALFHTRI